MTDVWILASDQELASETASTVAALGLTPRRAASNGDGRPHIDDGGAERPPGIMIVIAAPGEPVPAQMCRELLECDGVIVPLVLAVDEAHLQERLDMSAAHELIVRPYTVAELSARIQRARAQLNGVGADEVVRAGTLAVNLATFQVRIGERTIDFSNMEYELLKFLITHPHRVLSREALLSGVWSYDYYGGARTVDVHIRRLRAKLGPDHADRIKTVRGFGYRFEL